MADNKFLLYELIKNNDKFNPNTEDFQDKQLITRAAFEDMLDTDNYSWSGEKYQQNQFIYEYEIDNIETTENPDINDYIEIVGGTVQTKTYNNSEQSCEFKIKMKGDTVLHKDEDYLITSSSDSFDVTSDTDPTSPYYETITMYGTDAETYYVTIEGIGDYQDSSITLKFIINKKSLSEATITQNNELVFSGGINDELNPEFKIQFDNDWYFIVATNTTSNNFDVTFNKTTGHGYAGEHTNEITIKAKNNSNYTGSVQVSYFVNSATPSISFVKNNTQVYDEFTPRYFKVNNSTVAGYLYYKIFDIETSHEIDITDESTYDGKPHINTGDDISVSNAYRINVGTYYIVATFVPNNSSSSFSDTPSYETVTGLEGTLIIKNEGDLVIVFTSDTNNYVYDGEPKTPNFRVECNGDTISRDNYTYSYDNNTNAGTAKLTVTGKNNYNGKTAEETFIIKQAEPVCSITSNNITYGEGTTSAFTFKINNNLNGSLTYTIYDENGTTVDSDTINVENNDDIWETDNNTDAGTYHINASFRPADENYKYVSDINDELTIDKATPTLIVNNVNTEFDFNMHYLSVEPSVDGILKFNRINSSNNNIYTQGCTANNTQYLSQIQEFNNTVETYNGSLQINLEFTPNNTNYNTITTEGSINITPRNINQTVSIWLYDDDWNEYTGATYIYDGNEKQPNIKIYISDIGNNGKTIELRSGNMTVTPATQDRGIIYRSNGVSYEVIYENNINANNSTDPSVTVDISGNMYANPITTTFVINKADLNLEIGFGTSINDVSTYPSVVYDPNNVYYTFCSVYDDDNYAIKGTIHYKITTEEIENITEDTKDMLTNSSQYTETGKNPGYILLEGNTIKYTDAGEYYLYAYFEPTSDNYNNTNIIDANLIIEKADPDIQVTVKDDLIYNTKYQELISVSNPHNLNILYLSSDNEITEFNQGTPFSANIPSYKDVCTKYVYYKFNGNDNYEAIEPTLAGICTISPYELRQDNTAIQGGNYTYTGNSIEPAYFINVTEFASGSNPWLISSGSDYYIVGLDGNSPVRTDAGTYQVRIKGRNNYSGDFTVPFIINKATPSAISMEDQTKYYNNTTKTFTITNNNNVAGTITYTVDKTIIDIDGNETNVGRVESSEQISANSSIDINIDSYVGVYNINSVKFTPSDTTNYNVYNKSGSNNLTIEPDVTDIWISNMPASSFDPGTALTGGFTITQGQSLQLYVVGRESGWYNGNGVDSRYEEIDEEITVTGDTTICTINNNELYGVNIGSSTLHVTYRNDNGVTKSHTSNVTVTSAVVGLAAYIKDDNDIYETPTSSSESDNMTVIMRGSQEGEPDAHGNIPYTHLEIMPESFNVVVYEILQTSNGEYELGEDVTANTRHNGTTSGGCTSNHFTCSYENTNGVWTFSNFDTINYEGSTREDYSFPIQYNNLSVTFTITFKFTV